MSETDIRYIHNDAVSTLFDLRRSGRISWREFTIGVALATFVDKSSGRAWPSRVTLAGMTGTTERNVSLVIRKLEEVGFIVTEIRSGQSNVYRVTPVCGDTPVYHDTPCRDRQAPPVCGDRGPLSVVTPRTINEPTINHSYSDDGGDAGSGDSGRGGVLFHDPDPKTPLQHTKNKKPRKQKPVIADEMRSEADAIRQHYHLKVKPKSSDNSAKTIATWTNAITALLGQGISKDTLIGSIDRYAAECRLNDHDDPERLRFRQGLQTFFGPRYQKWKDYLQPDGDNANAPQSYLDPDSAPHEASSDDIAFWEELGRQRRERDGVVIENGENNNNAKHGDEVTRTVPA